MIFPRWSNAPRLEYPKFACQRSSRARSFSLMKTRHVLLPDSLRQAFRGLLFAVTLIALLVPSASSRAVNQPAAFELLSAESVQDHGGQIFGIPLYLDGSVATECRSTRGNVSLVFTFNDEVVSGDAALTGGTGRVAGTAFSGNTMTVSLTNVTDVQFISVTLSGVRSGGSEVLEDTTVILGMLVGDADQDRTVTSFDTKLVREARGQPVGLDNFRKDIRVDGLIDAGDLRLVRRAEGNELP